jgi:hypothetical protein
MRNITIWPDEHELGHLDRVTLFGLYATILERPCVLLVDPIDDPASQVYKECCAILKICHLAAARSSTIPKMTDAALSTRKGFCQVTCYRENANNIANLECSAEILGSVWMKLREEEPITAAGRSKIARCIIYA